MNPDRNPFLADFDARRFAKMLADALARDGRGLRAVASDIGVTATDLSRASSGTNVSAGRLFAMADYMGVKLSDFYMPPEKKPCKNNVLHRVKRETIDGLSGARPSVAPSGETSPPRGRAGSLVFDIAAIAARITGKDGGAA